LTLSALYGSIKAIRETVRFLNIVKINALQSSAYAGQPVFNGSHRFSFFPFMLSSNTLEHIIGKHFGLHLGAGGFAVTSTEVCKEMQR
jgi:hypothetical protein